MSATSIHGGDSASLGSRWAGSETVATWSAGSISACRASANERSPVNTSTVGIVMSRPVRGAEPKERGGDRCEGEFDKAI